MVLSGSLCTIVAGVFLSQLALAAPAFRNTASTTAQGHEGDKIYMVKNAGIQLLVPPGWEVKTDTDGTITFSKQQGDGLRIAAISVLPPEASDLTPEAQFKYASQGVFSDVDKTFKEFKLDEPEKRTQNGMPITTQEFRGKQDGIDMVGVLAILKADKPVLIYVYGTAKISEALQKETHKLLESIKKID
jgi:hypothetical protein